MVDHVPGFPRFTIERGKMSGQICVRGYRFTLNQLLEMIADGMNAVEIVEAFPFLEIDDVIEAHRFAANEALQNNRIAIFA